MSTLYPGVLDLADTPLAYWQRGDATPVLVMLGPDLAGPEVVVESVFAPGWLFRAPRDELFPVPPEQRLRLVIDYAIERWKGAG